jgi:hypothetical protein
MPFGLKVRIVDNSARYTDRLMRHIDRNMHNAAVRYLSDVRAELTARTGSDNDDEFITIFRGGNPVSVRTKWEKPYVHSRPGQSPFAVHGDLANSYHVARAGKLQYLIGSNDPVSIWQSVGTRRQEPREHLPKVLRHSWPDLRSILTYPMR